MKKEIVLLLSVLQMFLVAIVPVWAGEVHLSVAASMTDAIKELDAVFMADHPGVTMLPNFGSSGSLAKQVAQGAAADLFVSANPKWMSYLETEGKIARQTVRDLAKNTLVVIGPQRAPLKSLNDLQAMERIALGSPGSVPAGQYAAQAMRAAGVYDRLVESKKLVMAKDVRQALLYADRGEVDGAFVYGTDALLVQKAVILYTVPANLHDPISYPMGLTVEGEKNSAARAFYDFLASPAAIGILEKYGFGTPAAGTAVK
ncbi:MAG: molybdate ABC transporter substrate-binding protein [Proteobacteria bacterium]|nr:molybdate ABC transporter substrate-binding protein [Pseudomonadota bacterium]MBU0965317.1 molybdate ABC transporter substrate-binding protein [Pseudomonadota bacterium]